MPAMRFVLPLLLLLSPALWAQTWKVGLASVKITPGEPVLMAGYAGRDQPFQGIDGDLFAKALALEDAEGKKALIITADLLGFPADLAERICSRIQNTHGLAREEILLNASHTHSGPLVAGSLLQSVPTEMRQRLDAYIQTLEDKAVQVAGEALNRLEPSNLDWGVGIVDFVMNRREFTPQGVKLGVNPRGFADRSVPVMRIRGADGKLRGIVFGAASHCTTLTGGNLLISGDYAGWAQAYLELELHGIQAMFLTGCAGDANPYPRGTVELVHKHGRALSNEVLRVLKGNLKGIKGPLNTQFRTVKLPLTAVSRAQIEQNQDHPASYRRFFYQGALKKLRAGGTLLKTYPAPFALWRFGDNLTLVAFSGETLGGYALHTERLLGPLNLWVAGYSNDLYGYLPTVQALQEGGYETRGLYSDFGLFEPSVEKTVMDAVADMARAVGRLAK